MADTFQGAEKRRFLRVHPAQTNSVKVAVKYQDILLQVGQIKDVSLGGIAFRLSEEKVTPPVGEKLNPIELDIPDFGKVQAQGVVRRCGWLEDTHQPFLAIEFTKLPYSGEKRLFQYIKQRHREIRMFSGKS
ncbi:MAG TPA: hypothetical protein ENG82_06280 [Bacteroidetes bacterium]|nr:hypothetical protein [Bacteroidota bacterium]